MRPLFGVNVSTSAAEGADPVGFAQRAEALGFDFLSASDHPSGSHPTFETWTLLTWLASATTRVSVASRVLSLPLRPPALVAKMAESLDRLSGGRLVLGLGAGATDPELERFGLAVPTPAEKIAGMGEAVSIIRGLWSQPAFTYTGAVHRTSRAEVEPKPAHHIPIWLGTFGDRALEVTGRLADGWIPSLGYVPDSRLPEMRGKVMAAARSAGRAEEDITCVLNLGVAVGGAPVSASAAAGPGVVAGTAQTVAERLHEFCSAGFTGFNFLLPGAGESRPKQFEQIETLAAEVIPRLRR